jgi:hypothetical protein
MKHLSRFLYLFRGNKCNLRGAGFAFMLAMTGIFCSFDLSAQSSRPAGNDTRLTTNKAVSAGQKFEGYLIVERLAESQGQAITEGEAGLDQEFPVPVDAELVPVSGNARFSVLKISKQDQYKGLAAFYQKRFSVTRCGKAGLASALKKKGLTLIKD